MCVLIMGKPTVTNTANAHGQIIITAILLSPDIFVLTTFNLYLKGNGFHFRWDILTFWVFHIPCFSLCFQLVIPLYNLKGTLAFYESFN